VVIVGIVDPSKFDRGAPGSALRSFPNPTRVLLMAFIGLEVLIFMMLAGTVCSITNAQRQCRSQRRKQPEALKALPDFPRWPGTQPVLRVRSTNVHEQDLTPLEYVITRFRADRI
jgi:hypothetical protein